MLKRIFATISFLLVVAYPLAAHLSVLHDQRYALWVLLLLLVVQCGQLMLQGRFIAGFVCVLIGAILIGLLQQQNLQSLLLLAPILILSSLLWLFASTLLPGKVALITRFAELTEAEPLTEVTRHYTRRVTWLWVLVFMLLLLESMLLAWLAPLWLWSLFTNGLNYLLVLLVLLIEFRVRMKYLPQTSGRTFKQFLLQLIKIDWRRLARSDEVSP